MQEEPGETLSSDSDGAAVWLCPLCQQGQTDREALALHLTDKHSVLPACLEKLMDIAVPMQSVNSKDADANAQNNTDTTSSEQESSLSTKSPSEASLNEGETAKSQQIADDSHTLEEPVDKDGSTAEHEMQEEAEGIRDQESEVGGLESDQENVMQSGKVAEASVADDKSAGKNSTAAEGDGNRPFRCNACLESFPTRTALSVHYNSATHVQRMRTGAGKQSGESNSTSAPYLSRPYISNKPYQCAVCRVSYNHAITLESHLKSVLHQTRSRSAGNVANSAAASVGNGSAVTTMVVTGGNVNATTSNCVGQAGLAAAPVTTKDREQIQPQLAPSLLSSPVASAQAVSAFLTLLTSSPNSLPPSILPSLFAAGTGATPGTAAPQLLPQPQMLMPLILNGLQNQNPNPESQSPLLSQSVPILGLSAAQQALLAQRLSGLQSQWAAFGLATATQTNTEETEKAAERGKVKEEMQEESRVGQVPLNLEVKSCEGSQWTAESSSVKKEKEENESCAEEPENLKTERSKVEDSMESEDKEKEEDAMDKESVADETGRAEGDKKRVANSHVTKAGGATSAKSVKCNSPSSCASEPSRSPSLNHKQAANSSEPSPSPKKWNLSNTSHALNPSGHTLSKGRPHLPPGPLVLSEFQSQVLWAFLESRSEADAASPPREDCEALGREVGLTEEEVRRWLGDARHAKDRQRAGETEHSGNDRDTSMEDEESALMIDETEGGQSPAASSSYAMDLSSSAERRREKDSLGNLCLTSDSENEEFYTSVIVTDEESQGSSMREEQPSSPVKEAAQSELTVERSTGGGKVLRSTTVFLSDAEEEEDDEEGGAQRTRRKKRKIEADKEEVDPKRERQDPDVDLELEAQADPPAPVSVSVDQRGLPSGILHSLPLSLSLAPFSTQFISPYVLSIPSSVVGVGVAEGDGGKVPGFPNPPTVTRCQAPFADPLNAPPVASLMQSTRFLSNGGDCESALDLSMGKNHSSMTTCTSVSAGDKSSTQKGTLLDGLGLRPTAVGVPGEGGLIVVQVKPDSAIAIPTSNNNNGGGSFGNRNNLVKTNTLYMRAAERVNTSMMEKEKEKERERERERDREQKRPKARRFRDMRRSRTIIQADQLDVLYGCYFKDPNPGKYEFEQISEWVHLPKKVVQIWFQNMRARERKGEVRFISDGTLAAVGKPLIKFTWPLTQPIFSSTPKSNANSSAGVTARPNPSQVPPKSDQLKEREAVKVNPQAPNVNAPVLVSSTSSLGPKAKAESANAVTMVKIAPKTFPPVVPKLSGGSSSSPSLSTQKRKHEEEHGEEGQTDDEGDLSHGKPGPGATNRMVPKLPTTPITKSPAAMSQKHNGQNYWSQKGSFKINTLSREQLGLGTPRSPSTTPTIISNSPALVTTTSSQGSKETNFTQHSTPRRPRTHLTCLQLSILQSCYETCAHPNALECEAVGTELGLPLKVVQIWFQNTRAKEKRWRLQQEKQSPNSSDPSKKVDVSSGSYLQYNALRANRPILPKPVQLTVVEPSPPPTVGQPAGRETLRGKCDACDVTFESRAAARAHVFSPRHLATLRTTNFGQPASLVNSGSGTGSSSGSGATGVSSTLSPASSTST